MDGATLPAKKVAGSIDPMINDELLAAPPNLILISWGVHVPIQAWEERPPIFTFFFLRGTTRYRKGNPCFLQVEQNVLALGLHMVALHVLWT